MGCDIHQYVLIYNKKTNQYENAESVFGKWELNENYEMKPSEFPPVWPILGRWYWYFGVIAGVRSDEFEIQNKNEGIFPDMPELMKNNIEENGFFHSFTWYDVDQFISELKKTIKKINKWIDLTSAKDPDWIKGYEYDEYCYNVQLLVNSVDIATGWEATLKNTDYDYHKTIVGFYFDN